MQGIQYIVDDKGEQKAVVIDLSIRGDLWEDFYDLIVSKSRERETVVSWEELKKEIGEWERHRVRLQEKMQRIEKRKQPLFENLGVLADQNRIDHESLFLFYSQIDRNIKRSEEIKKQLQELD